MQRKNTTWNWSDDGKSKRPPECGPAKSIRFQFATSFQRANQAGTKVALQQQINAMHCRNSKLQIIEPVNPGSRKKHRAAEYRYLHDL